MGQLANVMGMGFPPALDVDLLRSFVLIAEGGSFTTAAERVGRTQSAVSLQVRRLESLVGQRLFIRSKGGGVEMTSQGRNLLGRAREMMALNDDVVDSLRFGPKCAEARVAKSEPVTGGGPGARTALPEKPSIAVLPFRNMSGDPWQDYFADGIAENVATGLSRIKWLFVIACYSSIVPRNTAGDVRRAGRELGARYVLEGGVSKAGGRIRITAQLIETETKALLWADQYDGALEDMFDIQDRITDCVVGIVEPNLRRSEIERSRRKRAECLDAYDLYLRALPLVAAHMPKEAKIAIPLLEEALRFAPDYAAAHALLAWFHELCFTRSGFEQEHKDAALAHARTAIAAGGDDASTFAIAGFVLSLVGGDKEPGLIAIDHAVSLNPSCAIALYLNAQAHGIAAQGAGASAFASRALRLSPFDPLAFEAHLALGESAMLEARFDDASSCFARAVGCNANFSMGYFFRAKALALGGREQEARRMARLGLEIEPDFRMRFMHETGIGPALAEILGQGARVLGLPE